MDMIRGVIFLCLILRPGIDLKNEKILSFF